jgi:hypothetical protein
MNLYELALGVAEAYFVAYYHDLEPQCTNIWAWILTASVFNIVISVLSFCYICCVCCIGDIYEDSRGHSLHLGQLIVGIWAITTYFKIEDSCQSFWESNSPELWTFVLIHYVMGWFFIVSILCSLMISCCCVCCCCIGKNEYKEINSNP